MRELKIHQLYRTEGSTVFIDITIDFYREVFNTWDFSPLLNRDLDDDLFEYLESCCREIPKRYSLKIVLHLPRNVKDPHKEELNSISFLNFFSYKLRKLTLSRRSLYTGALWYLLFGVVFISLGYLTEMILIVSELFAILQEGFFIGGWVLFWELFTALFFRNRELKESLSVLKRLRDAKIEYEYK